MIQAVVFDTKSYDRDSLQRVASSGEIEWRFMDWRLSAETAAAAKWRAGGVHFRKRPRRSRLS